MSMEWRLCSSWFRRVRIITIIFAIWTQPMRLQTLYIGLARNCYEAPCSRSKRSSVSSDNDKKEHWHMNDKLFQKENGPIELSGLSNGNL
jgi:hypothetical protein